jgi:mRNA interferase RelE/StbE
VISGRAAFDEDIANSYITAVKTILYLRAASRELVNLPLTVQGQIEAKLTRYAQTGAGDVKALAGQSDARIRSGDYRIIFTETEDAITVRAVRHRRDANRKRKRCMSKPQVIRTDGGEELVVISLAEYQRLLELAGDDIEDALEDDFIRQVVAETDAAIARGDDVALPLDVWKVIDAGKNAVRVLRKHRGLTQAELAKRAGITQAFLSESESGRKTGTADTLKSLAKALAVPLSVLVD